MDKTLNELIESGIFDGLKPFTPEQEKKFSFMKCCEKSILDEKEHFKLNIKFVNKSSNPNPEYATKGSSGFDLRADLIEPVVLFPGKRSVIPTGLYFELPPNTELQIRARSGLAAKNGITVLNGIGTIDSDYRGEIKVILINHGEENFTINHGDRIAQAVMATTISGLVINLEQKEVISDDTVRGAGGIGSTGVK